MYNRIILGIKLKIYRKDDQISDKTLKSMTKALKQDILNDVTYIYSLFAPNNSERTLLSAMKRRIFPRDMEFIDLSQGDNQKQLAAKSFISPYDVIMAKSKDRITQFYLEFQLSSQAKQQLEKYGGRQKIYTDQFQKDIETSMNNTIKAITREIDSCILQKKEIRYVIQAIRKVLENRAEALTKFLDSSYGQMAKYMILWEYQDKGYEKYVYITEVENCDVCDELDGQVFSISNARIQCCSPYIILGRFGA